MTKEEKMDMFSMRLDGYSLQQIGDKYGITREWVRQIFDAAKVGGHPSYGAKSWVYPNAAEWARKYKLTNQVISKRLGISANHISGVMRGTQNPSKKVIDALLKISGMTYEEFFYKPEK